MKNVIIFTLIGLALMEQSLAATPPGGNMSIVFSAPQESVNNEWSVKTINITNLNITADINWLNFEYKEIYSIDASVLADRKEYTLEIVCTGHAVNSSANNTEESPIVDFYEYCDDNVSSVDNNTISSSEECEILYQALPNNYPNNCKINIHKFGNTSAGKSWLFIYSMNITLNYTTLEPEPSPTPFPSPTPDAPPSDPPGPSGQGEFNLSIGAIIGIVVACILLVAMIIVFILMWKRYGMVCKPNRGPYARE